MVTPVDVFSVEDEALADAHPHVVQDTHAHRAAVPASLDVPCRRRALHQDAQHERCFLRER